MRLACWSGDLLLAAGPYEKVAGIDKYCEILDRIGGYTYGVIS